MKQNLINLIKEFIYGRRIQGEPAFVNLNKFKTIEPPNVPANYDDLKWAQEFKIASQLKKTIV
jgi:hypothetical protein